jgi:hypothetical protein
VKQDFATKSDCTVKVSLKLAARSDSRTEE